MENQQKPRKNLMWTYGLILGFVGILQSVAYYAMNNTYGNQWYKTVISLVIMAVVIFLGIKECKKNNNGFLSLGQGLKTGIGIALVGAIISVIYTVLFAKFIEPNFVENIVEMQRQQFLENPKMTDEMIDTMSENTRKYFYPVTIGVILISSLFFGFVISLITSLIMQKKEEQY